MRLRSIIDLNKQMQFDDIGAQRAIKKLLLRSAALLTIVMEGERLVTCDYCKSLIGDGVTKCANCGAPVTRDSSVLADYRFCPACHRKLLALGSPACSYCGRRLPDEYIRAREEDLKRITEVEWIESANDLGAVTELFSNANRRKRSRSVSDHGVGDITSLIDFFS